MNTTRTPSVIRKTAFRRAIMSKHDQSQQSARPVLKPVALCAALLAAFAMPSAFAFNSGSTGADGALAPTAAGTVEIQLPPSGILNYTSINIPAGVTVKFKKNALNTPVHLLVSGDVTIAGQLRLDGTHSAFTGTAVDGVQADDGNPGIGGPGGFDGGRGGRDDTALRNEIIRGGAGLGPGGGLGGLEGANQDCNINGRYYPYIGGGAGHATRADGYNGRSNCGAAAPAGARGVAYGSNILQPLIGGSGGGGGRGGKNFAGSGGGGGGGAILIAASGKVTMASTGYITADGGAAGISEGQDAGGVGGAGAGGSVRIIATTITGNGTLTALGACYYKPGLNNYYYYAPNGYLYAERFNDCGNYGSSVGRIRLEADVNTFTGPSYPPYFSDTPGPIFLSSLPSLRIASVAGTAVPANPTGNADVTLPANVANPVAVNFETTNVPTGNTVLLRMIPAYGTPIEVLSPAIAGTTAAGTASVQVALPQGPSVLQATTTYTVVVAMGEALSRFANNERVEKVQLIATLGAQGENQAKLITVSGKEFTVPTTVLQMVGFTG
jgi:hypothetical protein